jgi:hypothetical protein
MDLVPPWSFAKRLEWARAHPWVAACYFATLISVFTGLVLPILMGSPASVRFKVLVGLVTWPVTAMLFLVGLKRRWGERPDAEAAPPPRLAGCGAARRTDSCFGRCASVWPLRWGRRSSWSRGPTGPYSLSLRSHVASGGRSQLGASAGDAAPRLAEVGSWSRRVAGGRGASGIRRVFGPVSLAAWFSAASWASSLPCSTGAGGTSRVPFPWLWRRQPFGSVGIRRRMSGRGAHSASRDLEDAGTRFPMNARDVASGGERHRFSPQVARRQGTLAGRG